MKTKPTLLSRIRRTLAGVEPLWVLLAAVTIIFLGLMVASNQPPEQPAHDAIAQADLTPTPQPQPALTTEFSNTPIPREYLANATQTNGIVFGSVILVLIVVIGTLGVMLRKDPRRN